MLSKWYLLSIFLDFTLYAVRPNLYFYYYCYYINNHIKYQTNYSQSNLIHCRAFASLTQDIFAMARIPSANLHFCSQSYQITNIITPTIGINQISFRHNTKGAAYYTNTSYYNKSQALVE